MKKIVFLQSASLGEDVDLSILDAFDDITYYPDVPDDEGAKYANDAEVVITNENVFDQKTIDACPRLKLIALTSTGTNTVDVDYCTKKGIKVANAVNYSTDSVAQMTITMALVLSSRLKAYDEYVKKGDYDKDGSFSYFGIPFHNFSSMTYGIVGLGHIGRKVAKIATSLGAEVIYTSLRDVSKDEEDINFDQYGKRSTGR